MLGRDHALREGPASSSSDARAIVSLSPFAPDPRTKQLQRKYPQVVKDGEGKSSRPKIVWKDDEIEKAVDDAEVHRI